MLSLITRKTGNLVLSFFPSLTSRNFVKRLVLLFCFLSVVIVF